MNQAPSSRAVAWVLAVACLAPLASVRADSDANVSMTVAVDPPNPVPGQPVTATATFSNVSPDARILVKADFTMDPSTSFGRPLPGGCSTTRICQTFQCYDDEIECFLTIGSGSPDTIALTFTFPAAAERVYVEASGCRVSSDQMCVGGVGTKLWVPDPPPLPQAPTTGCASAGDSAGDLFTTVVALGVLARWRKRA